MFVASGNVPHDTSKYLKGHHNSVHFSVFPWLWWPCPSTRPECIPSTGCPYLSLGLHRYVEYKYKYKHIYKYTVHGVPLFVTGIAQLCYIIQTHMIIRTKIRVEMQCTNTKCSSPSLELHIHINCQNYRHDDIMTKNTNSHSVKFTWDIGLRSEIFSCPCICNRPLPIVSTRNWQGFIHFLTLDIYSNLKVRNSLSPLLIDPKGFYTTD